MGFMSEQELGRLFYHLGQKMSYDQLSVLASSLVLPPATPPYEWEKGGSGQILTLQKVLADPKHK